MTAAFYGIMGSIIVGRISIIEISALIWMLLLGGHRKIISMFSSKYTLVGLLYVSAFFLLVADIINQSSLDNLIKGPGAYIIFPTTVAFISSSLSMSQLWFALNILVITNLFQSDVVYEIGFAQEAFKFGYSYALVFVFLSLTLLIKRSLPAPLFSVRFISIFTTCAIVILGLWGNLRLLSLCAVVAYAYSELTSLNHPRLSLPKINIKSLLFVSLILPFILVAISIAFGVMSSLLSSDLLPIASENAVHKSQSQASGFLGVLFGGRSEIFASILAWFDRPWFGWGSWAVDVDNYYRVEGANLQASFGYLTDPAILYERLSRRATDKFIPTHSALLNLLVWSGIFGFLPAYIYFSQTIINLTYISSKSRKYVYPFMFATILGLWSFLFSPFGYTNRIFLSFLLSIPICWLREFRERPQSLL